MKRWAWLIVLMAVATGCPNGGIENGAGNGIDPSNGSETQPAGEARTVDAILDALEQAGHAYPQIAADVRYHVDQPMTGDTELRTGSVKFQRGAADSAARFYVNFETLKLGSGPTLRQRVEYAFDGRWVTIAKHAITQMTRFEVAAEGQQVDAFKLGEGPFPVPFGQEAEAMRQMFDISLLPSRDDDPAGTERLALVPLPQRQEEIEFTRIELWVDRTTDLPVRVVTRDKNRNLTTVDFDNIDTDQTFDARDFRLPRKIGWDYGEERLQDR